jgi:hypothetical protein
LNLISLSSINDIHWQSICRRLRRDVHPAFPTNRFIREWIKHKPGSDFEGILCHLKGLHGGNIRSAVSIDASSRGTGDPYDVTNYGSQINWYTRSEPNSWLRFDFKDRRVLVNSYTMKSRYDGYYIPRSWVIEGRNCDTDWVELDRHDNDNTIQGGHDFHNFKCAHVQDDVLFRYIRMRMTDSDSSSYYHLVLCNFELFGQLTR